MMMMEFLNNLDLDQLVTLWSAKTQLVDTKTALVDSRLTNSLFVTCFSSIEPNIDIGSLSDSTLSDNRLEGDYKELVDTHKSLKEINSKILSLDNNRIDPDKYNSQEGEIIKLTKKYESYKQLKNR